MSYAAPKTVDDVMNRFYADLHWLKVTLRLRLTAIHMADQCQAVAHAERANGKT